MGLCRVDIDRLRGLASRLGAVAVALEEAAPAATLLAGHGYPGEAMSVAGAVGSAADVATAWSASLLLRADLLDADAAGRVIPQWTTPRLVMRRTVGTRLATQVGAPDGLVAALGAEGDDACAALLSLAARGASADDVAAFFADLPEATSDYITLTHPDLVGTLDGAPIASRFMANGLLIDMIRGEVVAALRSVSGEALGRLTADLAVLDDLRRGGRSFLTFDWASNTIVEWIGPHDARHVAVYVPGAGVGRHEFPAMAAKLRNMTDHDPSDGDLAVLAALVYETPPTIAHAALGVYADRGGQRVAAFLESIDLTGRQITLVGHSYGAVVVGDALRGGLAQHLPPDSDVVALGAPGVRADHVSDLGVDPSRFWAALLPADPIAFAAHPAELPVMAACATSGLAAIGTACGDGDLLHGRSPAAPAFGGRVFGERSGAGSHGDYLAVTTTDGVVTPSLTLRQLLLILVGRGAEIGGAPSSY